MGLMNKKPIKHVGKGTKKIRSDLPTFKNENNIYSLDQRKYPKPIFEQ